MLSVLATLIVAALVLANMLGVRLGSPSPSSPAPSSAPGTSTAPTPPTPTATPTATPDSARLAELVRVKATDAWVVAAGRVERLLEDDNVTADGSDRHQRFLIKTDDGLTVLISHNIDTSARVPLRLGDRVTLRGEYEWTDRGGTIHFTHKPKFPTRRKADDGGPRSGWIEHKGVKYE
jgi:hypothetical protein